MDWDFLITYLIDTFFFKYNVDIKYILLFIFFFKDLVFSLPLSKGLKKANNHKFHYIKNDLSYKLLNIYLNNNDKVFDYTFEYFLYTFIPFDNIKVKLNMIDNRGVSSWFLAQYFAIRLLTGHSVKMLVKPVIKQ